MIDWPFPPLFADVHRHPRRAAQAVARHIAPIMRVSGALTFPMVYAAAALDAIFAAIFATCLAQVWRERR